MLRTGSVVVMANPAQEGLPLTFARGEGDSMCGFLFMVLKKPLANWLRIAGAAGISEGIRGADIMREWGLWAVPVSGKWTFSRAHLILSLKLVGGRWLQ